VTKRSDRPTGAHDLRAIVESPRGREGGPAARVRVDVWAGSHAGRVRPNNEDHFVVARLGRSLEVVTTNLPPGRVPARYDEAGYAMAVADGMGGASAGEVASALALSLGTELALGETVWPLRLDAERSEALVQRVHGYFREIDRAVADRARANPALSGMGTTLTVAYSVGLDLLVFYVGDSRAYVLREGQLYQVTRDQTLAQELADAGKIRKDQVASHDLRHVLTQAIGVTSGETKVAVRQVELEPGDRLLLCTDGLSDMAAEEAITAVLSTATSAEAAGRALLQLALDAGGRDNVTAVTAFYSVPTDDQ
jgi:serine/threonine protein phosphatase PrpC